MGLFHSTSNKPASTSTTAPVYGIKPTESKKIFTVASFSSSKPKPKIFVGAAFFNTGKKPKSMYKKTHTVKPSNRSTSSQIKCQTVQKSKQLSSQTSAAVIKEQGSATVRHLQNYRPQQFMFSVCICFLDHNPCVYQIVVQAVCKTWK